MILPSFDDAWREGRRIKPRILVLEIKDKNQPDSLTLGWLLVEREETYKRDPRDNMIYEASIRLSYKRILPANSQESNGKGWFAGSYSRSFNCVSLTSPSISRGAVFLDLPDLYGQRIGTYLMNEIVQWVQQWPDAMVNSIELDPGQAQEFNKARRNRFYEQFGLVFDYLDKEHKAGKSRLIEAGNLRQVETWMQNITELRLLNYLTKVLKDDERIRHDLKARDRACTQLIAEIRRAEKNPVKWAFQQIWWRYSHSIFVYLFISGMVVLLWANKRAS